MLSIIKDPYAPVTEEQLYDKLEKSRQAADNGELRDADDMVADMRVKYDL